MLYNHIYSENVHSTVKIIYGVIGNIYCNITPFPVNKINQINMLSHYA